MKLSTVLCAIWYGVPQIAVMKAMFAKNAIRNYARLDNWTVHLGMLSACEIHGAMAIVKFYFFC